LLKITLIRKNQFASANVFFILYKYISLTYNHEIFELLNVFADAISQYEITFEQNSVRIIKMFYGFVVNVIYWVIY